MPLSKRKHSLEVPRPSKRTRQSNETEIQTTEDEVPLVEPNGHNALQHMEITLPTPTLQSAAEGLTSAASDRDHNNGLHGDNTTRENKSTTTQAQISTAALSFPDVSDIGLSEIYNPSPETTIVADIVFVHGIMGNPVSTWLYGEIPKIEAEKTAKVSLASALMSWIRSKWTEEGVKTRAQKRKSSYCYWPFQLLPQDFKDMRILTYGYDSYPTHWYKQKTTQMTITQHAENLLTDVTLDRSECRGRPLIFVAHSLGGILVQSALNESLQMKHQPAYADLQESCHSVIFFGTPHLGADTAAWGQIVSNVVGALPGGVSTYSEVLRGLTPDSETLYNISKRFNELLNASIPPSEKIQICSIQEGRGMTSVRGLGRKVVPDYSSKFNRTDIEQSFFIQDKDHMDMCKFSSASAMGYKQFVKILKGYRMAILQRTAVLQEQQQSAALLKQLNFYDRLEREQQLNRIFTNEQSFEWVWDSDFVSWLQSPKKLFWIVGYPASGKSTLINYIAQSAQLNQILERQSSTRVVVIRFFFDFRAVESIRNNFQGFMRSLLYQILQSSPRITATIEQKFALKHTESHEWLGDHKILKSILEHTLRALSGSTLLFLDGLDEYEGKKPELIRLINDIAAVGVKICLTSRDESPFSSWLKHAPSFRMDQLNRPGIEAYANTLLTSNLSPDNNDQTKSLEAFARHIAERSSGIFLWARFAVLEIVEFKGEDIMNAIKEGRSFDEETIDEILRQIPPELRQIYSRIFATKRQEQKVKCGIILRLITSARRTLHISELYEASVLLGFHPAPSGKVAQADLMSFMRDTKVLGSGLIELGLYATPRNDEVPDGRFVLVKIIHRTVQTHLEEQGWKELLGNDEAAQPEHLTWLKACSAFLEQKKLEWTHLERVSTWSPWSLYDGLEISKENIGKEPDIFQLNLSEYVELFLPQHAHHLEERGTSSRAIISAVLTPSFLRAHALLYFEVDRFPECFKGMWGPGVPFVLISGVHLAIAHQLHLYVQEEISQNPAHVYLKAGTRNSTTEYSRGHNGNPMIPPVETIRSGRVEGPSLLETAVLCSALDPSATRSALVEFLARLSPRLNDENMLFAIRRAPPSDLKVLLRNLPQGKLQLTSKHLFHDRFWPHPPKEQRLDAPHDFGPLWDIACRVEDNDNVTKKLIDFFVECGEDINAQCGPYGTALHSAILYHIRHGARYGNIKPMLALLIGSGANPNAPGPEGNSLEFVWKLGNTSRDIKFRYARRYAPIIQFLIENGAVNEHRDPNGKIPTVEKMLKFGTTWKNYVYGKRYYQGAVESIE